MQKKTARFYWDVAFRPNTCPFRVIRVGLAVCQRLPLYPDEQTSLPSAGMSQSSAFSSVAPRLPAQSSTYTTTMAICVATIMTDSVTNPNTKETGSCEKIT
jgi:hypothetical protein